MGAEPLDHLGRVLVGRKHRVEDFLDAALGEHQGQTLHEGHPLDVERRQPQCAGEDHVGITQHIERHVQSRDHLLLVLSRLRAQAEHVNPELAQLSVAIAEAARLRRAAACAGDCVPTGKQRFARPARARVAVHDDAGLGDLRQVDPAAAGGAKLDGRDVQARQMPARSIVDRYRQVRRERLRGIEDRLALRLDGPRPNGPRPEGCSRHCMEKGATLRNPHSASLERNHDSGTGPCTATKSTAAP